MDLLKTQTVLTHYQTTHPCAWFRQEGDDSRQHEVGVDKNVWKEMGSPLIITVTIESGDKINV